MLVSQLAGVGTEAGASEGVENVEGCLVRAGQTWEGAPAKHALSRFGAYPNTLGQPQAPTAQCQVLYRPHNSKASRATGGAIRPVFLSGAPWGLPILINPASYYSCMFLDFLASLNRMAGRPSLYQRKYESALTLKQQN